jgi:hypothetical protein
MRPSIFASYIVAAIMTATVIFLVFAGRPLTARSRSTIARLRNAVGLINQQRTISGVIPTNLTALSLPGRYYLAIGDDGQFLLVAPEVFYRDRKPFNYACDSQTNVVVVDVEGRNGASRAVLGK